jgi:hypothetical protein
MKNEAIMLDDDGPETREDAAWRRLWERDLRKLSRAIDTLEDFHTLTGPSPEPEDALTEVTRDILLVLRWRLDGQEPGKLRELVMAGLDKLVKETIDIPRGNA